MASLRHRSGGSATQGRNGGADVRPVPWCTLQALRMFGADDCFYNASTNQSAGQEQCSHPHPLLIIRLINYKRNISGCIHKARDLRNSIIAAAFG